MNLKGPKRTYQKYDFQANKQALKINHFMMDFSNFKHPQYNQVCDLLPFIQVINLTLIFRFVVN